MRALLVTGLLVLIVFFTGCNSQKESNKGLAISDYFNRTVIIPDTIGRILPLYYVQAEIICALGEKDKIIGIGKIQNSSSLFLSTYFPNILTLPQVGQGKIDFEKVILLHPDIVFTGADRQVIDKLTGFNLLAVATYPKTVTDIYNEVKLYSKILKREKQGLRIYNFCDSLLKKIQSISTRIPVVNKPSVYYIRTNELTTIGGNVMSEIVEAAGGRLITKAMGDDVTSIQLSLEDICNYNPEVIIIRDRATLNPEDIYSNPKWQLINAVKNKRIYKEHPGWTEYRIETVFSILEKAIWLHPALYKQISIHDEYEHFINIIKENYIE
ncbi:MAG: ABC transporter substrate-binding protein [Ignavibacteria bacterium]|nr:ABC transporter substrate-binding protein [Ignavibacteria bacterium]